MTARRSKSLSFTQRRWLNALAKGENPGDYLHGQSEHGGATGTVASLFRRGYINQDGAITPAGLAAIGRQPEEAVA